MKNDTTDAPWNKWGDWGECSSPCGDGEQERMRNCSGKNSSMTVQCIGPNKETRPCNDGPCKVKILDCDDADWQGSLDRIGWSVCPRDTTFLKGLWRHDPMQGDNRVGRIEYGKCCAAEEPAFINQSSTCLNADWSLVLDRYNVWALCPTGSFMNGLSVGKPLPAFLNDIEEAKCCHPQNHPTSYEDCYDEDVTISFDTRGWSECRRDGYYMTGFYKSSCDKLYCIEKFRCCKMKNETVVSGRWSDWEDWGECNAVCGDGERERKRTCTSSSPSKEQARCSGPSKETRPCNNGPCHESESGCPEGWVHYGNSCFLVIDIPIREWKDARRNCQKLGGDLAKITSATQNQFLLNLLKKQVRFTSLGAWIGLQRRGSNTFYWTDNTPLTGYTAWNAGEPNYVFEKCVHLIGKNWRKSGRWNDNRCILPSWIHYEDAPVALCQKTPNEMEVSSRLR
ncbi:semaphorin-5B-like [Stylophora pistillata]|uniref:semaphorin-5B-like n=1 Tax=Stylophora pistillata TaxID=50429 RepID=UPI000C04E9AC|nr:semaphorin-5B-like [Stylophora pistillata]